MASETPLIFPKIPKSPKMRKMSRFTLQMYTKKWSMKNGTQNFQLLKFKVGHKVNLFSKITQKKAKKVPFVDIFGTQKSAQK